MRISYNPRDKSPLTGVTNTEDLIFDLSGKCLYVKGVKLEGTDTTYSIFQKQTSTGSGLSGLVPIPNYNSGSTNRYLREDGTWVTPPNTTYSTFTGASSSAAGTSGLVPAPAAGKLTYFLRGDATWVAALTSITKAMVEAVLTGTITTHTHNYVSTVIVGSTSYSVSGNTVTLPAYPTIPTTLKNPTSLTLKINSGTTEGTNLYTYDGSTAKTLNIVPGTNVSFSTESGKLVITSANTTYSAGTGLTLSGTTFYNSGVRSISTGSTNGTISVDTNGTSAEVSVKGLGSAAYTNSSAYAAASHSHSEYLKSIASGNSNYFTVATSSQAATISPKIVSIASASSSNLGITTSYDIKTYVDASFAANDAMIFKGTIGTNGTITSLPTSGYSAGWTYRVITAGTYAGVVCEVGDLIICIIDATSGQTAINNAHWTVAQTNIDGAVVGPTSSTDGYFALFNGTSGKVIKQYSGSVGSSTQGIYFSSGVPKAMSYTLGKSVPSDAVFTDTHYASSTIVGASSTATANAAASNGAVYLNHIEAGSIKSYHLIKGTGATTVTSDANGVITISSTNTVYTHPTQTAISVTNANGLVLSGITVNTLGHVTGVTSKTLTASDIPSLSYLPLSGGTMTGGIEIRNTIDGSGYAFGGGGYHNSYNNVILRGNSSTGVSGILFTSSKSTTSINQTSDRAFIQFHPYGLSLSAEGTNPTLATSGESNKLVIGVGNDADDMVYLQTPSTTGLRHIVGTANYVILDSGNYNSYVPSLTGSGASGTWGISISGNAATSTKLGTSTIGSSVNPIYLSGGSPVACSYAFGNSSGNVPISNGTVNTNLNANYLQGYNIYNYQCGGWYSLSTYAYDSTNGVRYYWNKIATIGNSTGQSIIELVGGSDANYISFYHGYLKINNYGSTSHHLTLTSDAASAFVVDVTIDTSNNVWIRSNAVWSSYMQYRIVRSGNAGTIYTSPEAQLSTPENSASYIRNNGGITCRSEVFTVSSALRNTNLISSYSDQLYTARTIWGQSFNGSGNVDGVLKITASTGNYCEGIRIKPYSSWSTILLGGNDLSADTGTSSNSWSIHNNNGNFYINKNASLTAQSPRLWGHSNGWTVGNTTASSYALNAASFYCASWVRTYGSAGWYSETYGGGWYMSDSTWIRSYGSKSLYCDAIILAGGRIYTGYDSGVTNSISCSNWFRSNGATGWYNATYGDHVYSTGTYIQISGHTVYTPNKLLSDSSACSWLGGLLGSGAYNVSDATDTGSYWPWLRGANTSSGKYFSLGVLGSSLYIIGSTTSRTSNGYDYGWYFNMADGWAYGNFQYASEAKTLARGGNLSYPMTFNWSGQSGQPTWLWGSNDGTNIYVWNPSNFSVNYATSAGSASYAAALSTARTISLSGSVTGSASFNGSSDITITTSTNHTHSYAGSSSSGGAAYSANLLNIVGYGTSGLSFNQTSGSFDGNSGWCHYIIANHGDGSSYYHYTIGLPFWSAPIYRRQTGSTSSVTSWYTFWTTENLSKVSLLTNDAGYITSYTNTTNTAGASNTTSTIYLVGATSQTDGIKTYSNNYCYASGNYLYSGGAKVLTAHQTIYTLTCSAGTFSAGSYTPNSAAKTIYIPTKTSHLTNDSGFITGSYLPLGGGTMLGTINSRDIIPSSGNSYNLGSSSYRWQQSYSNWNWTTCTYLDNMNCYAAGGRSKYGSVTINSTTCYYTIIELRADSSYTFLTNSTSYRILLIVLQINKNVFAHKEKRKSTSALPITLSYPAINTVDSEDSSSDHDIAANVIIDSSGYLYTYGGLSNNSSLVSSYCYVSLMAIGSLTS